MANGTKVYLNEYELVELYDGYQAGVAPYILMERYNITHKTFLKWTRALEKGMSKKRVNMGARHKIFLSALKMIRERESVVTSEPKATTDAAQVLTEINQGFNSLQVAMQKLVQLVNAK